MSGTTEAFARVKIDALLRDAGWDLTDGASVLFEHALADGTQADYVLCDRQGRPMAALEAKRASVDPIAAQDQGRHYAERLGVPFVFLSNGEEVRFLGRDQDADWTEKWWFAEAYAVRAADSNLSSNRHRPQNRRKVEHRDPLEILAELRAIETEILGEIDELAEAVRDALPERPASP